MFLVTSELLGANSSPSRSSAPLELSSFPPGALKRSTNILLLLFIIFGRVYISWEPETNFVVRLPLASKPSFIRLFVVLRPTL